MGGAGVRRLGNNGCGVAAALAAMMLITAGGSGGILGPAAARGGEAPLTTTWEPAEGSPRPDVEPAAVMAAYGTFDACVRAWAMGQPLEFAPGVEKAPAACVELRLEGKLIGRAQLEGADCLENAAQAAMRQADPKLMLAPDALREGNARQIAERMLISMELAGTLVPFEVRTIAGVDAAVPPGLEGVAVRIGERIGMVFPAEMLAENITPGAALGVAASRTGDASLSVLDPATLRKDHGAVLYRFRTVHVAQTTVGGAPLFLFRGGRVVPDQAITSASLREMADGIAAHLVGKVLGEPPSDTQFATAPAILADVDAWPAFTKGLVARSLSTYAIGARDPAKRLMARYAARAICEKLDRQAHTLANVAATINARAELARALGQEQGERGPEPTAMFENPAFAFDAAVYAQQPDAGWVALAATEASVGSPQRCDQTAELLRAMFSRGGADAVVAQMPFVAEAALRLAAMRAEFTVGAAPISPHLEAIREARTRLAASMVGDGAAPDQAGGFVFAGSLYPTWHSARPAAMLGQLLANPLLTPGQDRMARMVQALSTMRYLRQLCVDSSCVWMYADPARSMWGVRMSVWDNSLAPEASAMALAAVAQTLASIEAMEAPAPAGTQTREGP